jgi:hypothetical protein
MPLSIVMAPLFPAGHFSKTLPSLVQRMPSFELYMVLSGDTVIASSSKQSEKARSPISVTPFPIVTRVRLVQL